MLPFERAGLPPRSRSGVAQALIEAGLGSHAHTSPVLIAPVGAPEVASVPATFLEPAAGGAFELFPRRQFRGPGDLVRAALPAPLMGSLLPRPEQPFRATAPLPPLPALPLPAAPRLRRRA